MKTLGKLGLFVGISLGIMGMTLCVPSHVHAYTPTAADTNLTWDVINRLFVYFRDKNWPLADMQKVEDRLVALHGQYSTSAPEYAHTFNMAAAYLHAFRKKVAEPGYTANAEAFIAKYGTNIQSDWNIPMDLKRCFDQYPLIDHMARDMNMPPAYLMATRYIESTCRMYNPDNGDGVFQIINNYYTPGNIDIATLAGEIGDFETFIERKFAWYNSKQSIPIQYGYNTYNIDTLQTFAALYNGLAGDFTAYPLGLGNPYYFWSNYNASYAGRKDGWLVLFLKILKLENQMINR